MRIQSKIQPGYDVLEYAVKAFTAASKGIQRFCPEKYSNIKLPDVVGKVVTRYGIRSG